jgi:hypothetical protein
MVDITLSSYSVEVQVDVSDAPLLVEVDRTGWHMC